MRGRSEVVDGVTGLWRASGARGVPQHRTQPYGLG